MKDAYQKQSRPIISLPSKRLREGSCSDGSQSQIRNNSRRRENCRRTEASSEEHGRDSSKAASTSGHEADYDREPIFVGTNGPENGGVPTICLLDPQPEQASAIGLDRDIRDVVCPLWSTPYESQLVYKYRKVEDAMCRLTKAIIKQSK